jgi:RNA polymerase sigma-70 factor, ECF subfamily
MSAPAAAIRRDAAPVTPSGHLRLVEPVTDPIRRRRSSPALEVVVDPHAEAARPSAAIAAQRLDPKSRAWLDALRSRGPRREEAIGRLHALLLREARFEVGRRTAALSHPSGRDLDDLAMQAANDSVVAVLSKLDQFRGDSLFTTWARRFAQREAPAKLRRRLGRARELPSEDGFEHGRMWAVKNDSPHEECVGRETARTLVRLIDDELTTHQREVLMAMVIDDVPTQDLSARLDTTAGALYKTVHDARRKLRVKLAEV